MNTPQQFPTLDEFLAVLRFDGIAIGPHELVWLQHAFSLQPSLDRQSLKDLLACTLIKQESHREIFESRFADWCPVEEIATTKPAEEQEAQPGDTTNKESQASDFSEGQQSSPSQQSNSSKPKKHQPRFTQYTFATLRTYWRHGLLSLLVSLGLALGYYFWPSSPPVVVGTETTSATGGGGSPTTPIETALPSNPVQELWTWVPTITIHEPAFVDSPWAAGLLALLSGLTGGFLWWRYRQNSTLPLAEQPPRPGLTWVPLRSADHILSELVDREALRTAVWGVERFVSEDETTVVDIDRTVAATARAGGIPAIRHEPAVYPREVWLWHDVMVQNPLVDRLLQELQGSLTRAGLPVRLGTFAETPGVIRWREGQEFSPLVLEGHRQSALVVILTDGYEIPLAAQSELDKSALTQVLKAFGEWPRLVFVDVGDGKHDLTKSVRSYGLRCITPQEIPAFLAASPVTTTTLQRHDSELFGDLRAWAAATALSPEPVTEEQAFALRQRLGLDLSPWQFRDLLRESDQNGERLSWSPERRAKFLNWLVACSRENDAVAPNSLLARALDYWIAQYQEENKQREESENKLLPWNQTKAEQRLRMEIALLELWREPEKATAELYRLYGNLKEEIRERLSMFSTTSFPRRRESSAQQEASTIYLPWHFSKLPARTRRMLVEMEFAGRELPKNAKFQMPIKLSLALGACTGLALVALSTSIVRLMTPTPVFHPTLPESPQTVRIRDVQHSGGNDYRIVIGTPKEVRTETVAARSVINTEWKWQSQANVQKLGQSELWHAGTLPQALRGYELNWPRRSLFVIQAEPSHVPARQLAIQLLDRGSADRVLLGTDWASHLDTLMQVEANLTKNDQLILVLPSGTTVPKVDFQGARSVVTQSDFNDLISRLDFPGSCAKLLTEVWLPAETTGTPLLRGGPREQRDEKTGMTFATVCSGRFTMGSDKKQDEGAYDNETPAHPVTLSAFEISKTEVTNA
ncbi:MAG: hypothetical protein FJ147_11530 [Deltaproteobacteria bacterium]|nr:hypothetical protein [Deltaproteobacteria bacterium]